MSGFSKVAVRIFFSGLNRVAGWLQTEYLGSGSGRVQSNACRALVGINNGSNEPKSYFKTLKRLLLIIFVCLCFSFYFLCILNLIYIFLKHPV